MKVYPEDDPDFLIDQPNNWDLYCRYPTNYVWKSSESSPLKTIRYYRDFEGAHKDKISAKDLYIPCWADSRLKPGVCLNVFHALGNRFIKLEKAAPLDFNCAPRPMNLREVQEKQVADAKAAKVRAKKEKYEKLVAKACKQAQKPNKKRNSENQSSD